MTNGTQVTVTGQALGSDTVNVCAVGTASDCTSLNVTVQAGTVTGVAFNPSSLSLAVGGSQSVTVSGGNGTYSISNNTNTSVASTNLSGTSLTISGLGVGGATITVCDSVNTCGTLSVTISAAATSTSGLVLSPNSLSLTVGNNQSVTISGGNGTYILSSNTNSNAVSTVLSGSEITVYATSAGSATIKICDTSGLCGTLTVTAAAPAGNQAVVFSVASPSLTVGQNLNVQLSGSASTYVLLTNTAPNLVQASISGGTTLMLSGTAAGTDSLTICATGGGCSQYSVVVTGAASVATTTPIAPAVTTVTPTPIQPASVVANTALLAAIQTMQTAITQVLTQIQSIQAQLNQLQAQVSAGSGSGIGTNASVASSGTSYNFTELLTVGSQDAQVAALQNRLTALGFYSGPITGYFGALTGSAVSKYQTAHGIAATGYTGPSTRTALNAGN